jgi:hypothetical protein
VTNYLIGFDRFVALEWANYALELSSSSDSNAVKVSRLKDRLSSSISGEVSIRKTANVLARLWLEPNKDFDRFRSQATNLALVTKRSDYIFFHWGMALLVFPFFRETATQIGRLSALQNTINRKAIHSRVAEKYSNQGTVPRSVDRILQSLIDWQLLVKIKQQEFAISPHKSTDPNAKRWLLEATTYSLSNKRVLVDDFYRLPELYPFEFNGDVRRIIADSSDVRIERDGNNSEYLQWSGFIA